MKRVLIFCLLLGFTTTTWGFPAQSLSLNDKLAIAKERCSPTTPNDDVLYNDAFRGFNRSVQDLDEMYPEVYNSEKRLANRIGFYPDEQSFISKDSFTNTGAQVAFTENLIKAVTLQIEKSMLLNYVKYVFFPDMGHSHLFIPLEYYESEMSEVTGFHKTLELALKAPKLKLLYHTAEQLGMLDDDKAVLADRYLQWRFYTRNPVGDMNGNIEILADYNQIGGHNTVRDLAGYRYYSGFNLSANKNGCFPFQDKSGNIQYFDISAWDIPYQQGSGDDGFPFVKGNSGHKNYYTRPSKRPF